LAISYHHARKALKVQARCRATLMVLLAFAQRRRPGKFPNLNGRTIQELKPQLCKEEDVHRRFSAARGKRPAMS
jgi:hypothetical protein